MSGRQLIVRSDIAARVLAGLVLAVGPVWETSASKVFIVAYAAPRPSVANVGDWTYVKVLTANGQQVCNSDSFTQIDGQASLFVGRAGLVGNPSVCANPPGEWKWSLAFFDMDWSKGVLKLSTPLLNPPRQAGGLVITSAYDPYSFRFAGRIWLTFECVTPSVDACVVPFTEDLSGLDFTRLSLPVRGRGFERLSKQGNVASASVPKVIVLRGEPYLYWVVVKAENTDNKTTNISSRGMKLSLASDGRLWGAQSSGRSVEADDERITSLVAAPDGSDASASRVAEIEDLRILANDSIEVLLAVGGGRCVDPGGNATGCYRLMTTSSTEPLGDRVFSRSLRAADGLPANPQEYARFFVYPSGKRFVMGQFLEPKGGTEGQLAPHSGLWQIPVE